MFSKLTMKHFIAYLFTLLSFSYAATANQIDNGVILIYHHVSEKTPPSTSISPEKFRQQMEYLAKNHTVMPLNEMVENLKKGQAIADKAVAITFDDGYQNILTNGHPILKEYGFSYTIFINPALVGSRKDQLTWQQISDMQQEGVLFANHTMRHDYLLKRVSEENDEQWLARMESDILQAESLIKQKTGSSLKYVAYPYGEYNQTLANHLKQLGFTGFGQHSGAIASFSDFTALPRFSAAGIYANLNTLKTKLNSLAMPVIAKAQNNPQLKLNETHPVQSLTLNNDDFNMSQIGCFLNGAALPIQTSSNILTLKPHEPLTEGRSRINCTAPSKQFKGRYYWYSQPWFMRQ